MISQRGFTLVEALVTGVISSVLAGSMLTLFYLNNSQINAGIANSRLIQSYEVVSQQIFRVARKAYTVSETNDYADGSYVHQSGKERLTFFDKERRYLGGFRVRSDGYLLEVKSVSPLNEQLFLIGTDSVKVLNNNCFTISTNRRVIHFSIDLETSYKGAVYTLRSPNEYVRLRNNDR